MSDAEKRGLLTKVTGDKRRWQYKARVRQLPPNYREAAEAIERYLMHIGPTDGDSAVLTRERKRLISVITRAAGDDAGSEGASR